MKIAFDAKRAFLNKSGLGNYSRSTIKSLIQNYSEEYFLYTPRSNEGSFLDFISHQKNIHIIEPQSFLHKQIPSLWRTFEITNQLNSAGIEVYHGLSNELPRNISKFKGKKIVTVHDLIYLRFPELYPVVDRQVYDNKCKRSCMKADVVVAVSEQTKKDLIEFYRIPEQKIKVVYQSCAEVFYRESSTSELNEIKEKYKLPDEFLLSVGTIEERKNLITILKAMLLVEHIKLVVVGKKRAYFKEVNEFILKNKLSERVLILDNVETSELPAMYRLAKIFIYPSLFEGFGIPVLEAITCKTPIIASGSSSLPEAGGSSSLYIDATNHFELADLIRNLIQSQSLRMNVIEKGYEHSKKFRPEAIAKAMMKIYTE